MVAVNAKALFGRVREFLSRYYSTAEENYDLLATFVFVTHTFDHADAVPYLHLVGEPGTGKTRLGELLELLAFEPRLAASMTPAAVYRFLQRKAGTLILDEEQVHDALLRRILRAGYRRSGYVSLVERGVERQLPCFCPKVLLTNEPLKDDAIASRTILLVSEPATRPVERFIWKAASKEALGIRLELQAFAEQEALAIDAANSGLQSIDELSDREQELASLPMALAMVIDHAEGSQIGLQESLARFFKRSSAARRLSSDQSERRTLARLVTEHVEAENDACIPDLPPEHCSKTLRSDEYGLATARHAGLYLAAELTAYVNSRRDIGRVFRRPKELGELLNNAGLVEERRIIRVPVASPGQLASRNLLSGRRPLMTQRTAYRFNLDKAAVLAREVAP